MNIKNAHILEVRQHHNKNILVQIQVLPRDLEYYNGQTRPHRTYRWMQAEDWAAFDAKLETLIASKKFQASSRSEDVVHYCQLNKLIQVRVKKSRIMVRALCRCVIMDNIELNEKDVAFALECIIEYRSDGKWNKVVEIDQNEYEPKPVSSQSNNNGLGQIESSVGSYVPYTPSAKKNIKDSDEVLPSLTSLNRQLEDEYTPAKVGDSSPDKISQTPSPVYTAARIRNCRVKIDKQNSLSNDDEEKNSSKEKGSSDKDEKSTEKVKLPKRRLGRKKDKYREKTPNEQEFYKDEIGGETQKTNRLNNADKFKQRQELATQEDGGDFLTTYGEKYVSTSESTDGPELRRSSRSPHKTKRLIEENLSAKKHPPQTVSNKRIKSKSPTAKKPKTMSDIFGSDDEDHDADAFIKTTPKTSSARKHSTTDSISCVTKRKRIGRSNNSGNCEKEKYSMEHWLSKKENSSGKSMTTTENGGGGKKGKSASASCSGLNALTTKLKRKDKCDSPVMGQLGVYPSLEEMEKQMCEEKLKIEKNRELNAILTEMVGPPPVKVDTLTLIDMSSDEIMDSYMLYKPMLDEIFQKLRKKNDVRGHDGIDHYLVIGLIDHNMQLLMMQKLCEMYENIRESSSVFTKLFTNAMMPEWILSIFMDKYNFTRAEAIKQVKDQEEYRLHLEAQSENSILI